MSARFFFVLASRASESEKTIDIQVKTKTINIIWKLFYIMITSQFWSVIHKLGMNSIYWEENDIENNIVEKNSYVKKLNIYIIFIIFLGLEK